MIMEKKIKVFLKLSLFNFSQCLDLAGYGDILLDIEIVEFILSGSAVVVAGCVEFESGVVNFSKMSAEGILKQLISETTF